MIKNILMWKICIHLNSVMYKAILDFVWNRNSQELHLGSQAEFLVPLKIVFNKFSHSLIFHKQCYFYDNQIQKILAFWIWAQLNWNLALRGNHHTYV